MGNHYYTFGWIFEIFRCVSCGSNMLRDFRFGFVLLGFQQASLIFYSPGSYPWLSHTKTAFRIYLPGPHKQSWLVFGLKCRCTCTCYDIDNDNVFVWHSDSVCTALFVWSIPSTIQLLYVWLLCGGDFYRPGQLYVYDTESSWWMRITGSTNYSR